MANPKIKVKRSSVEGKVPAVTQLERGELAVNSYDGKVYILKDQFSVGIATTTHTINPWNEPSGVGAGISYSGNVRVDELNVIGVSTFRSSSIFEGSITCGDDSAITGGAPTDQGNLAVYGIGKNSVIIQATNNGSDRGIAWRNTGDAYAAFLNAQNAGNNTVDLVFGVAASSGPHTSVNDCPERLRISNDGNIGVNQSSPSAKLDVNGTLNVDGTATLDALTVGNYDMPTTVGAQDTVLKSDGTNVVFGSAASATFTEKAFTATQGQTVFTDTTNLPTYVQVFVNGIKIRPTSDFSKSGASITLVTGATAGDEIDLVRFD